VRPILQRHLLGLAHPDGQQAQRRAEVALAQQRGHDQGEGLRRAKTVELALPEAQVGRRLAPLVPAGQGDGHAVRRGRRLAPWMRRTSLTSAVANWSHHNASRSSQARALRRASLSPEAAASLISRAWEIKGLFDHLHQFVERASRMASSRADDSGNRP